MDLVSNAPGCLDYSKVQNNEFSIPHSNSFVDFNGDCAADLFITSKDKNNKTIFETWLRNPEDQKFCLVDVTSLDNLDISFVVFGDMGMIYSLSLRSIVFR